MIDSTIQKESYSAQLYLLQPQLLQACSTSKRIISLTQCAQEFQEYGPTGLLSMLSPYSCCSDPLPRMRSPSNGERERSWANGFTLSTILTPLKLDQSQATEECEQTSTSLTPHSTRFIISFFPHTKARDH